MLHGAAQTRRVHCGNQNRSGATYREVFEFDFVTDKPQFPGGNAALVRYINQTRHYPLQAYRRKVQGRVTVSFIVNCDGTVSDACVLRGVEPTLNSEALRVIENMPPWHPGRHEGRSVPVRVIQIIPFRL